MQLQHLYSRASNTRLSVTCDVTCYVTCYLYVEVPTAVLNAEQFIPLVECSEVN